MAAFQQQVGTAQLICVENQHQEHGWNMWWYFDPCSYPLWRRCVTTAKNLLIQLCCQAAAPNIVLRRRITYELASNQEHK